jgi:DedD protein
VLVALGVIFIPMILERGSADESLTVRMEIPARPDVDFKNRLDDPPDIEEIEWPESMEQATAGIRVEKAAGQPDATPDSPPHLSQPAKPPLAGQPPAGSADSAPKTRKSAETPLQWIVQLGSFSKETNALGMQDMLKTAGYKAFVKAADTPAGRVYRVRIGPMTDRVTAQQTVSRLGGQGYKAIVMAYSEQTVIPD